MGKRPSQSAAKTVTKKPKVDPALASIASALKKASHLPDQCSAMLAAMLPFSLAIPSDERAESQGRVVAMVEETLNTIKSAAEVTISAEEANVGDLDNNLTKLSATANAAETTLTAKKEALEAARTSLAEATAALSASGAALDEQRSAHATCEGRLASVQKDRNALEEAFKTHFQTPMEAGQGPHFKELQPFFQTMDLEKSMISALPGICTKSKEDRGSFDQVILEQLEQAITAKIVTLSEAIATETTTLAQYSVAIKDADTDCASKQEVQNQKTTALEAAQLDHDSADEALIKANEALEEASPQLEAATEARESAKAKLAGFESGPLANFMAYKNKTVPSEAAPAGA